MYCAGKAFLSQFSKCLSEEYWNEIDCLNVFTGVVKTKLAAIFADTWASITPEAHVKATLCHLGKSTSTFGHWRHAVMWAVWIKVRKCLCCERPIKWSVKTGEKEVKQMTFPEAVVFSKEWQKKIQA